MPGPGAAKVRDTEFELRFKRTDQPGIRLTDIDLFPEHASMEIKNEFMRKILLLFFCTVIAGCHTPMPRNEYCTKYVYSPNGAYAHTVEKRYEQFRDMCEPEYKVDQEAFQKAYIEGRRQTLSNVYCDCAHGYYDKRYPGKLGDERIKNFFDKIQNDPLYVCSDKDGKSEYLRGIELATKLATTKDRNQYPTQKQSEEVCKKAEQ